MARIQTAFLVLALTLLPAAAQVAFEPAVNLPVGLRPLGVALGDVDADGDLDLAVTVDDPASGVSVWLNNGSGRFTFSSNLAIAPQVEHLLLTDLDRDGDLDLAVTNRSESAVSVFLNNGLGDFSGPRHYPVGARPRGPSVADLDRDGHVDLLVANRDGGKVSLLPGIGNGTFAPAITLPAGGEPRNVVAADLNRDGLPDIVTSDHEVRNLTVLINLGDRRFIPALTLATGGDAPDWVAVADLDRDGDLDLAAALRDPFGRFAILVNAGNGTFGPPTLVPAASNLSATTVVDVDGDGKLDLITANEDANNVGVHLGDGAGGIGAVATFATGLFTTFVAAGDLDRDDDFDLVAVNRDSGTVSVLINSMTGGSTDGVLFLGGRPAVGATIRLEMISPTEPAYSYVAALSFGTVGIVIPGGRVIPLTFDTLFVISISGLFGQLKGNVGTLDGSGTGFARLDIPEFPELVGHSIWAAFVTLDPRRPAAFGTISTATEIRFE